MHSVQPTQMMIDGDLIVDAWSAVQNIMPAVWSVVWNITNVIIVDCTALSGKQLHRQVGMGIVVTLEKPTWCNV